MTRARPLVKILLGGILPGLLFFVSMASGAPAAFAPRSPAGESREEVLLNSRERSNLSKGRVVLREIPNPGKPGKTFEALGILPCALDEAFAVITDYRCYPEYMPHVLRTVVRNEPEAVSVVEIRLGLPLGQSRQYRLKFEARRADEEFEIFWEKLPWPELASDQTIRDTSGRWLVRRFEAGGLLASYRVYADPTPVPLGLTGLANAFGKRSMPDVIEKTRRRIRALYHTAGKGRGAQNSCP